jgi:Zn-dependent protease
VSWHTFAIAIHKETPKQFPFFSLVCQMFSDPITLLLLVLVFLIAISCHEASHALAAHKLGDITPKSEGRLTLNPLAHLDIIGTIAIFLFSFGWGKPVRVNPRNFENRRRDMMLVAFAGPAANFALAFVATGLLTLGFSEYSSGILHQFLYMLAWLNALLGVFNLIPLPPLDGGSVLIGLLPKNLAPTVEEFLMIHGQVTFFVLLGIDIFFGIPIITGPIVFVAENILLFFRLVFAF